MIGEEVSIGGGDESGARVAVTVLSPRVFVRVIVEVEDSVVVGSAPASSAAKAARGKVRRVSENRISIGGARNLRAVVGSMKDG